MAFNCPVSTWKADQLIDQLALTRGQAVLDAGCGNGEFLLRLLARTGATGTGVDSNAASIAEAEDRAGSTLPNGGCRFLATPMADADVAPGSFDAAVCLGSTHAFGCGQAAWPNALAGLARLVRPGGRLLLGEGYWRQRLQTSREWRDGYLRWGRDTMGFGLYVFLRP